MPDSTTPSPLQTDGTWARAGADGAPQPIQALSPDAIERMTKSPPWIELNNMAETEYASIQAKILDPATPDEEATKLRHALALAKALMPSSLLLTLKIRHPRR